MFKILDGREHFYQWDLNRKVIVEDASIKEVHFSDAVEKNALVCVVYELDGKRVADVPNILLQTEWRINVYAYTDGHTKVSTTYKVLPRSKPEDYIYTETEVKNYEEFKARLAANEEAITALGAEIENIDVTESIEEYVDNHLESTEAWSYSVANLANKNTNVNNQSILQISIDSGSDKEGKYANLYIRVCAFEVVNNKIKNLVNHPFEVVEDNKGGLTLFGVDNAFSRLTNAAMVVGGDFTAPITLTSIIKDIVDGTTFTKGEIVSFTTGATSGNNYSKSFGMNLKIYSAYDTAIEGLKQQFNSLYLPYVSHILFYYNETPLNLVEGG